ncbi:short-chain dehydrogenase [Lasiosphaeria ovina]|uniref:Short-chain dehydrogenase n=1 Tax=Lasiosphaeria ovina TaxID=92902 RepID=A0AAE0KCK1_9PEZI|nr:short-chain dehydrogenase [Lasiosphaeria ovina]
MSSSKTIPPSKALTILITGCSPGGMGAALAVAFHKAGYNVYATGRDLGKLSPLATQGITTLALDVTSAPSIASAVATVSAALPPDRGLDMLVNNAAANYTMPVADASLDAAKAVFDVNVWAQLAVTQAFLPLLLRATTVSPSSGRRQEALIVNHTSVGSRAALPFQGVYNASKAALAMLSETLRLEVAAFGLRVVDLKTAGVRTNLIANSNVNSSAADSLPAGSMYAPAREVVEAAMSQQALVHRGIEPDVWAEDMAALLLGNWRGKPPPPVVWSGESVLLARLALAMPCNLFEGFVKKMTKLDVVEEIIRESRK